MSTRQLCVFCGGVPDDRSKEHVLPQWLLKLTGDPARVVSFGMHFPGARDFRFSFNALVFRACKSCNEGYSGMEARVQALVQRLLALEHLTAAEYVELLDWLDKVRIGLWLGYNRLHGNPAGIRPKFFINSRIRKKDRMLALYYFDATSGLNAVGVETLLFQRSPSAFFLRINGLAFLNASWDYMCSRRCGFLAPCTSELRLDDGGLTAYGEFRARDRVLHPVLKGLLRPNLMLFQPILQRDRNGGFAGQPEFGDNYLTRHLWPAGGSGEGVLFRQSPARTEAIYDPDEVVPATDQAQLHHWRFHVAQTYEVQTWPAGTLKVVSADPARTRAVRERIKEMEDLNRRLARWCRSMSEEQWVQSQRGRALRKQSAQ